MHVMLDFEERTALMEAEMGAMEIFSSRPNPDFDSGQPPSADNPMDIEAEFGYNDNIPEDRWDTAVLKGRTYRFCPRDYVDSPDNGVTGTFKKGWYSGNTYIGEMHIALENFIKFEAAFATPQPIGIYYTRMTLINGVHQGKEYLHFYSMRAYDKEDVPWFTQEVFDELNALYMELGIPPMLEIPTYTKYTDSDLATTKAKTMDIPNAAFNAYDPEAEYFTHHSSGIDYRFFGRY
jgi:hypothetical protein